MHGHWPTTSRPHSGACCLNHSAARIQHMIPYRNDELLYTPYPLPSPPALLGYTGPHPLTHANQVHDMQIYTVVCSSSFPSQTRRTLKWALLAYPPLWPRRRCCRPPPLKLVRPPPPTRTLSLCQPVLTAKSSLCMPALHSLVVSTRATRAPPGRLWASRSSGNAPFMHNRRNPG